MHTTFTTNSLIGIVFLSLSGCSPPSPPKETVQSAHTTVIEESGWRPEVETFEFFPGASKYEGRISTKGKLISDQDLFLDASEKARSELQASAMESGVSKLEYLFITTQTPWGRTNVVDRPFIQRSVENDFSTPFFSTGLARKEIESWSVRISEIRAELPPGKPRNAMAQNSLVIGSAEHVELTGSIASAAKDLRARIAALEKEIKDRFPLNRPIPGVLHTYKRQQSLAFTLTPERYKVVPVYRRNGDVQKERDTSSYFNSRMFIELKITWDESAKPLVNNRKGAIYWPEIADNLSFQVSFDDSRIDWNSLGLSSKYDGEQLVRRGKRWITNEEFYARTDMELFFE